MLQAILSSNTILQKTFVYDFLHQWFKDGLITSTQLEDVVCSSGSKWRMRRKLLTPAFHFRILEDFLPVIEEQSRVLVSQLTSELGKEEGFDIVPHVTLCSLDILCETAMGKYVGAQKVEECPYVDALREASETFAQRMTRPWLWPDPPFLASPSGRRFLRCIRVMNDFTLEVIREQKNARMSEGLNMDFTKRRRAFLDLLVTEHLADPVNFTEDDIREEVNTFMFAGHDTTAVGLSWAIYLLGLYPEVQQKAQGEVDDVLGTEWERGVTSEDLRHLRYLECLLKESQRLYPSLPFIGRLTSQDEHIAGYDIPRGTTCMVFTYMLHRNPEVFPDPEKFDPDRFLPENSMGRHPYAYVPFSAGPRNCIGQRFALMEQKIVLANLLRRYRIESLDPRDRVQLTAEMVLRSFNGLRIRLHPR
ncbi:CYP4V2 [Cordylochernes scorpioides]|uniref:CYP4V2 n=1 Tax=Cordylochernes scorpioides TaxID=51811 RepID=A0ABY6LBK6_9ARAC|nr:CYP4V2 [Cordylochernes scorpioides]